MNRVIIIDQVHKGEAIVNDEDIVLFDENENYSCRMEMMSLVGASGEALSKRNYTVRLRDDGSIDSMSYKWTMDSSEDNKNQEVKDTAFEINISENEFASLDRYGELHIYSNNNTEEKVIDPKMKNEYLDGYTDLFVQHVHQLLYCRIDMFVFPYKLDVYCFGGTIFF